jgi:hypothetical protein
MNTVFTLGDAKELIVMIVAIIAMLWRVENRLSATGKEALAKAAEVHEILTNFKLEVTEHYAKMVLIKDIETGILQEIRAMRKDFQDVVVSFASIKTSGRGTR